MIVKLSRRIGLCLYFTVTGGLALYVKYHVLRPRPRLGLHLECDVKGSLSFGSVPVALTTLRERKKLFDNSISFDDIAPSPRDIDMVFIIVGQPYK